MYVLQVGDQFGVLCMCQGGGGDVGLIVVYVGYVVEQMGEVGCVCFQCGYVIGIVVGIVVELYVDVECVQCRNQCEMLVDFWGEGEYVDGGNCMQVVYVLQCGFDYQGWLCVELFGIDEGVFQMYVQDLCYVWCLCVDCIGQVLQCLYDVVFVCGYGGVQYCCGVVVGMCLCDGVGVVVVLYDVYIGVVMYVQVDEVGQDQWNFVVIVWIVVCGVDGVYMLVDVQVVMYLIGVGEYVVVQGVGVG